jgi:hypothetical protein
VPYPESNSKNCRQREDTVVHEDAPKDYFSQVPPRHT